MVVYRGNGDRFTGDFFNGLKEILMKYYLVDNYDNIVDKIDSITPGGAEHYFMKRKQVEDKEKFYSVWKIQTKKEYDSKKEAFLRKSSSEWWNEEDNYLDIDKL